MPLQILVTGAGGQLAQALHRMQHRYPFQFHFLSEKSLDITDQASVEAYFAKTPLDFCINTAAYTAVDKAEEEKLMAFAVNVQGTRNLARACEANGVVFMHLSTDFVFDGQAHTPYTETEKCNPLNVYGASKLRGEEATLELCRRTLIVRTSWLYGQGGQNFVSTMLRMGKQRKSLQVVQDQVGTPTCADNLSAALLDMVTTLYMNPEKQPWGIYHYSNEGVASWYDFAYAIFRLAGMEIDLQPTNTANFPRPAKRPPYSVMDKSKIKQVFGLKIPHWHVALRKCFTWEEEI